jgi:phage repressor protein C with HTH and peptisase S24 domain
MEIHEQIREARRRRNLSQADVAKEIGISQPAYKKIESGDTKRSRYLHDVVTFFGLDMPPAKGSKVGEVPLPAPGFREEAREFQQPPNAAIDRSVDLTNRIPAYGQAVGGRYGQFILNGNRMTDLLAPPALAGVRGAYAVFIVGDSMEPRYYAGEAVFVNPRAPIRPGDFVVAQIATDDESVHEAYVKRFIGKSERELRLEQLKPKREIKFPSKRVISVHKIIMGGEG